MNSFLPARRKKSPFKTKQYHDSVWEDIQMDVFVYLPKQTERIAYVHMQSFFLYYTKEQMMYRKRKSGEQI